MATWSKHIFDAETDEQDQRTTGNNAEEVLSETALEEAGGASAAWACFGLLVLALFLNVVGRRISVRLGQPVEHVEGPGRSR